MQQLIQQTGLPAQKKRQFLLVLPVLVFPFLTFMLWSLGIFQSNQAIAANTMAGLNPQLPAAKMKEEKGLNKLSFYEQAERDSLKYRQELKNDPYFKAVSLVTANSGKTRTANIPGMDYDPSSVSSGNYSDPHVEKIHQKLAELNKVLDAEPADQAQTSFSAKIPEKNKLLPANGSLNSHDVDRLENMLQSISQKDTVADPEMQQLNAVMDKMIELQHPERQGEKLKEAAAIAKQELLSVSLQDSVSTVNGFYGLEDTISEDLKENAIEAFIPETQQLVSGATVKIALVNDIYISGNRIPAGSFVYGLASLNNERLKISISSLRYRQELFPVSLEAYDLDGLQGIYIPGSINREVAKESSNQAISSIGLTSLDPSVAAQATGAGIQAAKTLLSKKVKLVKVNLEAGYRLLLKNNAAAISNGNKK